MTVIYSLNFDVKQLICLARCWNWIMTRSTGMLPIMKCRHFSHFDLSKLSLLVGEYCRRHVYKTCWITWWEEHNSDRTCRSSGYLHFFASVLFGGHHLSRTKIWNATERKNSLLWWCINDIILKRRLIVYRIEEVIDCGLFSCSIVWRVSEDLASADSIN